MDMRKTCNLQSPHYYKRWSVINPPNKTEVILSHTHGPESMRVEMIKGITRMKDRAVSSEDTTRSILSSRLGLMTDSSISALPKPDSLKRTIRRQTSNKPEVTYNKPFKKLIEIEPC